MSFAPFIASLLLVSTASADVDVEKLLNEVSAKNSERICQESYRALGVSDSRVKVEVIDPQLVDGKFHLGTLPGYDPGVLRIGIANNDASGSHHFYVNIGRTHVSAWPFYGPVIKSSGKIALKGIYAEVPIPAEVARALEARAEAGKLSRHVSCLHAVCAFLESEGVVINERDGVRKARSRIVVANLLEGKIKIRGKDADPETMKIIATGGDELAHALSQSIHADARVARRAKEKVLFYVALPVGTVAAANVILFVVANKNPSAPGRPKYRSYEHILDD